MPMLLGMGSGGWELLATVIALPQLLGTQTRWPYFMLIPILPNIVHTIYAFIFPESPKYLFVHKRDEKKTLHSLRYYHGDNADLDHEMEHLEKEMHYQSAETASYKYILRHRHLRMPFFISIVVALSGIFNGQQLSNQYSSAILVLLGIPRQYSLLVILFNMVISAVLGIINALFLIERLGRRRMQLTNIAIAICGSACVCIATLLSPTQNVVATQSENAHLDSRPLVSMALGFVGFLCISLSYGLGIVTIPKMLIGELNPQATRGRVASVVFMLTNLTNFIIVLLWPPLQNAIGGYSILPITLCEVLCFVWLFIYLPETHNRPVASIVAQWYEVNGESATTVDSAGSTLPMVDEEIDERTPLLVSVDNPTFIARDMRE